MNTGKVKTTTNYSHELININRQVVSVEIISGRNIYKPVAAFEENRANQACSGAWLNSLKEG